MANGPSDLALDETTKNGICLNRFRKVDDPTTSTTNVVIIQDECLGKGHEDDKDDIFNSGPCTKCVERIEKAFSDCFARHRCFILYGLKILLLLLYFAYFAYSMYYSFGDEDSIVLLVCTTAFVMLLGRKILVSSGQTCSLPSGLLTCTTSRKFKRGRSFIRYALYIVASALLALYLGFIVLEDNPKNIQSLIGIPALIFVTYIFSTRPSRVNWHPVFWGFIIQFVFATITLRTEWGHHAFKWIGDFVQKIVSFSELGAKFLLNDNFKAMGIVFYGAGIIIFMNTIIYLMNHWGVLEFVIVRVGFFLSVLLDTGPVESVNAVASIFLGLTETPMLFRTYLPILSKSEVCSIMTCGFASISGSILGFFIEIGAPANHLLTAAIISAPAAMAFTKIACPETQRVDHDSQRNLKLTDDSDKHRNALTVCAEGAVNAIPILASVMANLLAFVSIIGMIDALLEWMGERAGVSGVSFEMICSYLLYPLSYVMGVEPDDCATVAALIAVKLFATPLVGYVELGKIIKNRKVFEAYTADSNATWHWSGKDIILDKVNVTLFKGVISERSEVISTYAMCGFSGVMAIGVMLGTMCSLCPARRPDIIDLVLISFFAGNMASFATGAVAGIMYTEHSIGSP